MKHLIMILALSSFAPTPITTSPSPKSRKYDECCRNTVYHAEGRNLEILGAHQRKSERFSSSLLICSFGMPRRRRRPFGLIPIATFAFWALVFWLLWR